MAYHGISKNKRVLVTGGAGFLGSHLCERLINENCEVICLDNLYSSEKRNIEHLIGHKNFEFIRHDITEPIQLEVEEIYNLACPASPIHYQRDPVQTIKTSILGAVNMLDLASRVGAKILQTSTSEIYGDPMISPQSESYWGNVNTIGPRSCYDEGKRAAETLFFDYKRQYNVDIRVVRIFNTYGPRMSAYDGRVISNFIRQCLKNEDITVYGDGNQTRSFCYVSDLIDGIVQYMNLETTKDLPLVINLGNPNELKIKEIAEIINSKIKTESAVIFKNLPEDDPKQRCPDIELAKKILNNWSPKVTIDEGLESTIAFFTKELKN